MKYVSESIDDILKPKSEEEISNISPVDIWKARNKGIFSKKVLASAVRKLIYNMESDGMRMVSHKLHEYGLGDLNSDFLDGMRNIIPWYVDSNRNLLKFWERTHAEWNEEIIILRDKESRIYLGEITSGNLLLIEFSIELIEHV
jgi:hypothetical protein